MEDKYSEIEKILAEREKIDKILKAKFSEQISIMFTDIKDYTLFYESYGDIAGRMMLHKHNKIVLPILEEFRGELVKTIGDATMTGFREPEMALRSAVKIQKTFKDFNKGKSAKEQIHVRIGINYGTVIAEQGDVFGDAVNVASRVEALAGADEIFITENLYKEVKANDELIFRHVKEAIFKGKKETIKIYRAIWDAEELSMGRTRSIPQKKDGMFVLEAARFGKKLKISAYERTNGEERTVKGYTEIDYNESKIQKYSKGITDLLNRANRRGKIGNDLLVKLKDFGRLMFDALLPADVKEKIIKTTENTMMISIDDKLVFIPWELLYDGREFLCQKFSVGRSVSTQQHVSVVSRALGMPLKIQLLTDPNSDLKASYEEGLKIKDEIGQLEDLINVSMKSTDIKVDYVKAKIRNFDIVHYAGHAEHNSDQPGKSGWVLSDGNLSAEDIINLRGAMPMPSLVFSNACKSAHTDEWKLGDDYGNRLFGLANAFLLSGVQHYVGTFWEIPDDAGAYFAVSFYRNISNSMTIGEAMRNARIALINKYGEDTIVWASYVLYGNPSTVYVQPDMDMTEKKPAKKPERKDESKPASETLASSELRHKENVISLGKNMNNPRSMILAASAAVLVVLAALFYFTADRAGRVEHIDRTVVMDTAQLTGKAKEEKRKRIDELVTSLAAKYRQGNFIQAKDIQDKWSSAPLTMVLMDVRSVGSSGEIGREKLASLLPLALQKEASVNIVEREILDKLLDELKLSTSDLADPMTSLKLGKVLSARIIMTGSIISDKKNATVILRCIDTETTAVRKVISAEASNGEIDMALVNDLGEKIAGWVRTDFPLRGKVLSMSGDKCEINLGQMHGLEKGDTFELISSPADGSGPDMVIGELKVTEVGSNKSWAAITGSGDGVKKGSRLRKKKGNI